MNKSPVTLGDLLGLIRKIERWIEEGKADGKRGVVDKYNSILATIRDFVTIDSKKLDGKTELAGKVLTAYHELAELASKEVLAA